RLLRVAAHPRRTDLVNAESRHGYLAGEANIFGASRFEHLRRLLASILEELDVVVAPLHADLQHGDAPRIDARLVDLREVVVTGQTLRPDAEARVPAAVFAHGLFVFGSEAGSIHRELRGASTL